MSGRGARVHQALEKRKVDRTENGTGPLRSRKPGVG